MLSAASNVLLCSSLALLLTFWIQSARYSSRDAGGEQELWIPVKTFDAKNVTEYFRLDKFDVGIQNIDELLESEKYAKAKEMHDFAPSRFASLREVESAQFAYPAVICPNLKRLSADYGDFDVCVEPRLAENSGEDRAAYSIMPRRDRSFETNFLEMTLYAYPLKVFVTEPDAPLRPFVTREPALLMDERVVEDNALIVERARISIMPERGKVAIKDLFDERADTHRVEFAFLDLGEESVDAMLAISWVIPACNFVVTTTHDFLRIRYMVLKLAYDTYYHYGSVVANRHNASRVHLSFMCRCCMAKYGAKGPVESLFKLPPIVP